jgi:hypothetical protein
VSDPQQTQSEGTEETFISHLVELRDRIIRAGISVIVVFLGLVYWAPDIFKLLARPLMMNLPKDGKLIVTDVTGSFFVPMKVTISGRSSRRGSTSMRRSWSCRWWAAATSCFCAAWRSRTSWCFRPSSA